MRFAAAVARDLLIAAVMFGLIIEAASVWHALHPHG